MSFVRVASVLVSLTVLCACPGRGDGEGPQLPTLDLPTTTVGVPYEVHLTATGGVPPLRYTIGDVPPGFSFYSGTALFTGPATTAGDYTVTIGVTDAKGEQDSRTYELHVYAPPAITTATLTAATAGSAYEFELSATGGQPPLVWSLAGGSLPTGLTMLAGGALSGSVGGQGSYAFTVRVQDANGAQATRQFSLEVRRGNTPDGGPGPDAGTPFPFAVGNWNIEWFGSTSNGPTDEQLQLDNVRAVIADAGVDFWGLVEIVDVNQFNALKAGLPGYQGFVANDPLVVGGSASYSSGEQKLAVLYKSDVVTVQSAQVVLDAYDFEFAGRPPLRVDLRLKRNGSTLDMVAMVLHMKAETAPDTADYDRRKAAGVLLKDYLDTQLPSSRAIVVGDWNDDVDVSIVKDPNTNTYLPSPYKNYVDAPADYAFVTLPLSQASIGSSVGFTNVIDHQLVTNEMIPSYVTSSAKVLNQQFPGYGSTTSDHYPVLSRYDFGKVVTPPAPPSPVFINEFLPQPYITNDFDQQFVEILNTASTPADLSGWKLHDAQSYSGARPARHVFAPGTTLEPGKVYVVYSGVTAVPSGGTNVDYANGNDGLRFNQGVNQGSSGDTVYLVKPDGTVVDSHYYQDAYPGISYNRSPDATANGAWVLHDSLNAGLIASPGKHADGTSF